MPEGQSCLPDPIDCDFFSPLLTKIDCRTKDAIVRSREAGRKALEELKDFVQELQSTIRSFEDTYRGAYEAGLERSDAPFYLEPRMFSEEPGSTLVDHDIQVSRATSENPPFEAESVLNWPSQSQEECIADSTLELDTIDPCLISFTRPIRPRINSTQSKSISRDSDKRARLLGSFGGDAFRGQGAKSRSQLNTTRSTQRQTKRSLKKNSNTITGPGLCTEPKLVVNSLIWSVAGIPSIIQLKKALAALRERLATSDMKPPCSTKEIWKRLDIVESSTHTNDVIHRLCLVRLNSRRNDLRDSFGCSVNRRSLETAVIDQIAKEVEENDRDKVKNRLHAGVVWGAISEEFSIGVLALIPTRKADWPSNTAVEKLSRKDLDNFLRSAKNDRHSFIRAAAQRVTPIVPLFEGTPCEIVLRLEQADVKDLESIQPSDESTGLELLDSV